MPSETDPDSSPASSSEPSQLIAAQVGAGASNVVVGEGNTLIVNTFGLSPDR